MVRPGKYRHFKGDVYEVVCLAKHSETEEPVVVYRCEKDGSLWVRPLAMFTEKVQINGQLKDRFEFMG